ncbi:MAG: hypothetical protein WDZ70_02540 [Candidatus Paceibacterota bacterium]
MNIVYIILSVIVGYYIGRKTKKTSLPSSPEEISEAQEAAREALSERTEGRKEEIVEMMQNAKERHEALKACGLAEERKGIHREDVERLLGVSAQTALKYLNSLEDDGKIEQIGVSGKDVYYKLIS